MFWYNEDIKRLEEQRKNISGQPVTVFYGSSTIRLWPNLATDFKKFDVVNLGFGGSTLAACTWFFDEVMQGYKAERLVLYAGDNDLGDGRHPEEVFLFFQEFATRVARKFGPIPCYFISLKPSMCRWGIVDRFKFTNQIIKADIEKNHPTWHWIETFSAMLNADGYPDGQYYLSDGLHLSEKGYILWNDIVQKSISA